MTCLRCDAEGTLRPALIFRSACGKMVVRHELREVLVCEEHRDDIDDVIADRLHMVTAVCHAFCRPKPDPSLTLVKFVPMGTKP